MQTESIVESVKRVRGYGSRNGRIEWLLYWECDTESMVLTVAALVLDGTV